MRMHTMTKPLTPTCAWSAGWMYVKMLQALGLAYNIRVPEQKVLDSRRAAKAVTIKAE